MALDAETLLAHSAWLAKFARALVANESELDDVVQQTFAQALAQPPRHARNLRGWLGTIARNVVRTRARSDSARVAREVALPPPPPVESPDQAVERAELRRMVVEAVLALSEPYRSAVILRFFEEQEVAEVARLTKTGEDTVRTRLRRGVARVRELLERRVSEDAGGAAEHEGAAARALLLLHLREIAANAGGSAGAGGGGATGSAAASRSLVRAGGRTIASSTTRRILVGAATLVVATGGFWWWKETRSAPPRRETAVATRPAADSESENLPPPAHAPAVVVAERSKEAATPLPTPTPPAPPPPRIRKSGAFRGVITDADGKPDPNAHVWAIASPNHEAFDSTTGFAGKATAQIEQEESGGGNGSWLPADVDDDGRYEITGLPLAPGWALGAFDHDVGAVLTDVYSLDHDHCDVVVDLKLLHGMKLRGSVVDENGVPVGGAFLTLYTALQKKVIRTDAITMPLGEDVGLFDVGFRCGDSLEMECSAPGFVRSARRKIDFATNATGADVKVTLTHRTGRIVRGRIVDPEGKPLEVEELLTKRLPSTAPMVRFTKVALHAIPEASTSSPPAGGASAADEVVEGRVDYEKEMYEVVVPDGFRGSLELRITGAVVGTAPLLDPTRPPDLPCDAERIPKAGAPMTFSVRFVDAGSKEPIDLGTGPAPVQAWYRASTVARLRPDSDPQHGVIKFGCEPGILSIRALIPGHAPSVFEVPVAEGPQKSIPSLEVPKAEAGVRGVVFHADGRPFAKATITLYRVTPEGLNDTTSNDIATNPDGEFEFSSLAKGEHVVVVSGSETEAGGITRFVASDPFPDVEVRCTTGSATRLRIDATPAVGDPPDTRLQIIDHDGVIVADVHRGWVAAKRSLDEFTTTLRPGHYTAKAGRDGYRDNSIEFDVPTPGAIDILLVPIGPSGR